MLVGDGWTWRFETGPVITDTVIYNKAGAAAVAAIAAAAVVEHWPNHKQENGTAVYKMFRYFSVLKSSIEQM